MTALYVCTGLWLVPFVIAGGVVVAHPEALEWVEADLEQRIAELEEDEANDNKPDFFAPLCPQGIA